MNALTLEWVEKAEGDFNTALRENRVRKFPNYDKGLNKYAVEFRYPGEVAVKDDAREAMKAVREMLRQRLGI
jgi:hypothetical protein